MVNIQLQKEEALKRLEILKQNGLKYSPAIKCFKDGKDIGIFENQGGPMKSVFYWLYGNTGDDDFYDQLAKKVKIFEAEENSIVYLILVSHTIFGAVCSFLYVSDSPNEWEMDQQDLKEGYPFVYVYNMDEDCYSAFGSIGYAADPICGGIYRTE